MQVFRFVVEVECDSIEQAEQVLGERLGHDEDYGFDYTVSPGVRLFDADEVTPEVLLGDAEEVEFCGCTNEQLEAGKTCGQPECPNL